MLLHVVFVDLIDANSSCLLLISLTQSLDQLIENTVPSSIRMQRSMKMDDPVCKLTLRGFFFFKSRLSHKHQPFDEFIRHLFFFLFVKKNNNNYTNNIFNSYNQLPCELGFVFVPFIASCCFAWLSPLCPPS